MSKENYLLDDVATSLNFGAPVSKKNKRVIAGLLALTIALMVLVIVISVVCVAIGEIPLGEAWVFLPFVAICAFLIVLIRWVTSRNDKIEKKMQECLSDAIATRGRIRYEPHVFNDGSSILTYVVYFSIDGANYAVAPINRTNVATSGNRKDLSFFVDKTCSILYSPQHNDVLILKAGQDEEII